MNQLRSDTTENKVSLLLVVLFAASLPFDRFYSQLLLLFLALNTLIQLRAENLRKVPLPALLLHSCIWLLTLLGTAYTAFPQQAFPFWERQLALLLLPLCLYLLPLNIQRYRKLVLEVFEAATCMAALYLFSDALRTMLFYKQPLTTLWSPAYLSHNFSAPLDIHATYLSLFFSISLCFALCSLLQGGLSRMRRIFQVMASALLLAALLQLASRAVLAGTAVVALSVLPFSTPLKKRRIAWFVGLGAAALLVLALLNRFPYLYERMVTELRTDLGTHRAAGLVSDPRGQRWELAGGIISQSPVIGHGSGSEVPLLREAYFTNGLYDSYLNSLNAHNQYLSLLLRHGAAGLLCWIATLAVFARRAVREKDILLAAFLVLVVVTGLSENILDVNKGIFFYSFFLALLGLRRKNVAKARSASNPGSILTVRIEKENIPS